MFNRYALQTQGILLSLFAMLLFSINDGIYKYVLKLVPVELAITLGFGFSFLFLMIYAGVKKLPVKPVRKRNAAVFSILFLVEQAMFLYALRHVPMAELFVVILATPVFVLAFSSLILKEHLSKQQVLAIFLGFGGALVVVTGPLLLETPRDGLIHQDQTLAWLAAIANVCLNGSKILYLRKYCQTENNLSLSLCASLLLALFFGVQLFRIDFEIPPHLWPWFIGCGLMSAIGFIGYVKAFQLTKAALVSATQYSQIIWAVLMGVFIFREELTLAAVTGSLLIMASGYFLYLKKQPV